MVNRVSRKIFKRVVGNPSIRKAVAFSIFLKDHNRTSIYKDFSYKELSEITGLSQNTCRKRVKVLLDYNIASIFVVGGVHYLKLHKLRKGMVEFKSNTMEGKEITHFWQPHNADVLLSNINRDTIKNIELGLMSLAIVEITKRKAFVKHQIDLAHNPSKFEKIKNIKRAIKLCNMSGYGDRFVDNGLSYRRLQKELNCSPNKVAEVVKYGEENNLFIVARREWKKVCENFSGELLDAVREEHPHFSFFATKKGVYYKPALLFVLR